MCNRTCDTVLFFSLCTLTEQNNDNFRPPPPPPTHIHTATKCVSSGGKRGLAPPPPY